MSSFKPQEISDFARHWGFHYELTDPFDMAQDVAKEMERGLLGEKSSLPMLPSHTFPVSQISAGKTALALDAGGSVLRAALVEFDSGGKAQAKEARKITMPGSKGRVSKEQFFGSVADLVLPLLERQKTCGIGFTFSYPMEAAPEGDGIPLSFSKEVDAPELLGKPVGKSLREALAAKGVDFPGKIFLINDAAATVLCGYVSIGGSGGSAIGEKAAPVVGFILGKGFNSAYPEASIPKIGFDSPDAPQIVVCETGHFPAPRGPLDREFDSGTQDPGSCALEKTVSGAYMGPLTLHILKQAVRDKVLCLEKHEELLALASLPTSALNEFLYAPFSAKDPLGSLFGPGEGGAVAAARYLSSIIVERGALFSAAVIAAAVQRAAEPGLPVRIAIDGTTYRSFCGMRRAVDSNLHRLLVKEKPRPYEISLVEGASLLGAAMAAVGAE